MDIYAKQKQTHRYRKQTCGLFSIKEIETKIQTTMYKIDKQQGYTI